MGTVKLALSLLYNSQGALLNVGRKHETQIQTGELKIIVFTLSPYLYCCVLFSGSKEGKGWVKCGQCTAWAHQDCAEYECGQVV